MAETKYGTVAGVSCDGYTVYKGIPYAQPPVGALRWQPPRACEPWTGTLQADHFGGRCPQRPRPAGSFYDKEFGGGEEDATPFTEDCLYLNIWAPDNAEGRKLPVAFYIHGGAFLGGCGHEKEFDGKAFARRDVILVTVNYRLGVWGFFAHPLLSAESEHGVSGNYGILDQIAALKWVRENIAAFGGDPDNITIFGQSAGAMSVLTLVCSELTEGMIAKAIVQSGLGIPSVRPLANAEADGVTLAEAIHAETAEQLRFADADAVNAASGPLIMRGFRGGEMAYMPAVDGYVLKGTHAEIIAKGAQHRIPYIAGSNRNDMATSPETLADGVKGPMYDAVAEFASAVPGVYPYYFTRQLPGDEAGAFHSAELWYVFGSLEHCWRPMTEADFALADEVQSRWVSFMRTGIPTPEGKKPWNVGEMMTFDI